MTIKSNTFDAGTVGAAVTVGNSGTSGDAFGAITPGVTYDDSQSMHGGKAAKLTGGTQYCRYNYGSFQKFAARGYFRMPADGSLTEIRPLAFLAANTSYVALVAWRQDGQVHVNDSTGTTVYSKNIAWQADTWYRIEMFVDLAAGSVDYVAYEGDSTTVFDSYSGTGMNYGVGNAVTAATFGNYSSVPVTMWVDSVAQDDAATGLIGPYSVPAQKTVHFTGITQNDGYTANTGTILSALSDGDDGTYVDGQGSLRGPVGTVATGPLTLTARASNIGGSDTLTLNLYQGSATTPIASKTFTIGPTIQEYAYTLTAEELEKVTDRSNLQGEMVIS